MIPSSTDSRKKKGYNEDDGYSAEKSNKDDGDDDGNYDNDNNDGDYKPSESRPKRKVFCFSCKILFFL